MSAPACGGAPLYRGARPYRAPGGGRSRVAAPTVTTGSFPPRRCEASRRGGGGRRRNTALTAPPPPPTGPATHGRSAGPPAATRSRAARARERPDRGRLVAEARPRAVAAQAFEPARSPSLPVTPAWTLKPRSSALQGLFARGRRRSSSPASASGTPSLSSFMKAPPKSDISMQASSGETSGASFERSSTGRSSKSFREDEPAQEPARLAVADPPVVPRAHEAPPARPW